MMKKIIFVSAFFLLSACGFTPMHAPSLGEDGAAFKNIKIDLQKDPNLANDEGAFWVQQSLFDRLGTTGEKHVLTIVPKFRRRGVGISSQDVATRYDMRVTVGYVLKDGKSGKTLDRGSVVATSTFGAPANPYGRAAAEQSATKNVSKEAADRLIVRLAAYYADAEK